jgi:aminopeptidase
MSPTHESPYKALAEKVVEQSLGISKSDTVTIQTWPHTVDLAEALAQACFKVGADAMLNLYTDKYYSTYLNQLTLESLREPSKFCSGLAELSTVEIFAGAIEDPRIFDKIAPERRAADREGEQKAHSVRPGGHKLKTATLGIGLVTKERAEVYGIDYSAWKKMMLRASTTDFDEIREEGQKMVERLQGNHKVRIISPEGTDLTFELGGREAILEDGIIDEDDVSESRLNVSIPSGSVSVAPLEDTVKGKIVFDTPLYFRGKVVRGLTWGFMDGHLSTYHATVNANVFEEAFSNSVGDKDRIASLTIGLNKDAELGYIVNSITRGAVTVSIGANRQIGGRNSSNFLLGATLSSASVYIDGLLLVKDGKLAL